jgi:hypothetical protein
MDTRHLPIRVRLALWYLASFFVVLVLFAAGTFYAMQAGIQKDCDRDLTARLAGIESFLNDQSQGNQSQEKTEHLQHELAEQGALRTGGELLQINDEYGMWIFQSPSIRHLGIDMPVSGSIGRPVFETVSPRGVPVRVITAFRWVRGKKFGIQIGTVAGGILGTCSTLRLDSSGRDPYRFAHCERNRVLDGEARASTRDRHNGRRPRNQRA